MDLKLKGSDIKTLTKTNKGWTYKIKVLGGNDIIGSEIPTEELAIKHCQEQLTKINLQMLKKR